MVSFSGLEGQFVAVCQGGGWFCTGAIGRWVDQRWGEKRVYTAYTHRRSVYTTEGSSLETIRHMVASGMGLTVLPCTAAGADRYSQRLVEIRRFTSPVPSREIALAWRASFPRPRVIDALSDAVSATQLSCVRKKTSRARTGARRRAIQHPKQGT